MTNIFINGVPCRSLVDTGCQRTVVTSDVIKVLGVKHNSKPNVVTMLDGKTTRCEGEVDLVIDTGKEHTSELQSPVPISYAVFCLKKKTI